ncbi:3-phosphoshikimate 1-carboxyvinyltransferase [Candidatus Lokiarchaeum ossiferum]|uniref:3-phosphoshikimate 1-carboxyvinyltransferase n=1 Tax=Candidatus Lokiarchaeum ossiferum TaxID=2951803 RepID=UPI00352E2955
MEAILEKKPLKKTLEIESLLKPIDLELHIPGSKSVTHRAFIMAALANGVSHIENPCLCSDTRATLKGLSSLGVNIEENSEGLVIHGTGGQFEVVQDSLCFENSGTSLRFFVTLCTLANRPITITGDSRMEERPIGAMVDALLELGCKIVYLKSKGYPPVKIFPGLTGGKCHLRGDISSQYFSSILISSPFASQSVLIQPTSAIHSRPYIDITLSMMNQFGIQVNQDNQTQLLKISNQKKYTATNYVVEGDFSSASYFFAAVAILGGNITLKGLNSHSHQGDIIFLEILHRMGCQVLVNSEGIHLSRSPNKNLIGLSIDMGNCPDLVQSMCIVASFASTASYISNIAHLKHKETDRIEATASELRHLGVGVETTSHSMKIIPQKTYHGGKVATYNDHRMAMAFAIMGLKVPGISIENPSCVDKSFPQFFELLNQFYA